MSRSKPHSRPTAGAQQNGLKHGQAQTSLMPGPGRDWVMAGLLVLAVLVAYHPVWHAGFIWDDDAHLTPPELAATDGLWRIWAEPGLTQQYYPLLHSVFWILNRVWGTEPTAYHLLGLTLHAANALLVWALLRKLVVPGAWLAATLFALHPVMVESVAWVSEIKNTLSGCFYLLAAGVYLDYDERRGAGRYGLALALFLCALLSKTVTATLPAALLVIFWWRRGRLDWRRDLLPLAPFLVLGVGFGLFTAWVEHYDIGARGSDYAFSVLERGLIAGRALCFYVGKLFWPGDLVFVYPRWKISSADAAAWLYPALALLVLAGCWWLRARNRGPLACALFFGGTLFPALGFINVFPFRYSFVADHFQYLASLGVFVLVAAGLARWTERLPRLSRPAKTAGAVVLGTLLGGLTYAQSRSYADERTLYRETLERNPQAVLAHVNLGNLQLMDHDLDGALLHYREAIRLDPAQPLVHYNLGTAYAAQRNLPEAAAEFRTALRLQPDYGRAHHNLGAALAQLGQLSAALREQRTAIRLMPDFADAHRNLARTLLQMHRWQEGADEVHRALELNPDDEQTQRLLASLPLSLRR